jgi:hypothetical protein
VFERMGEGTRSPDAEYAVRLSRVLYM